MEAKTYELKKKDVLSAVTGRYVDAEIQENHKSDTGYVSASTGGFVVNVYPEATNLKEKLLGHNLNSDYPVKYVKVFNPIRVKDYCSGLPFFEKLIDKRIAQMEGFEQEGNYFYDDCYNNIVYFPLKPGNRAYRNLFKKDFQNKDDFLKNTMASVEQVRKFQDEVLIVSNESQELVRKIYDSCSASGDLNEVRAKIEALLKTVA